MTLTFSAQAPTLGIAQKIDSRRSRQKGTIMIITYPAVNGGYKTARTCAVWMTERPCSDDADECVWHALATEKWGVYVLAESLDPMFYGLSKDQVKRIDQITAYETAKKYADSIPGDLRSSYQVICQCDGSLSQDMTDIDRYMDDVFFHPDDGYGLVCTTIGKYGCGYLLYFPEDGRSPRTDRDYVFRDRFGCTVSIRFDGQKFAVTKRTNPADSVTSIKELLDLYDMTRAEFSRRFAVPYRTVDNWYHGINTPPPYVFRLLGEALSHDPLPEHVGKP